MCRRILPAAALRAFAPIFFLLLAGCLAGGPEARTPGGWFPLEVSNRTSESVELHVRVLEPEGRSSLYEKVFRIEAGRTEPGPPVRLPYGTYLVSASTQHLSREIEASHTPQTMYQRLVVYPDAIAHQSG